jgi:Protein of unknown function (DUF3156)
VLALDDAVESLGAAGYTDVERLSPLAARFSSPTGGVPVRLELTRDGRIFGGNYGLELSTDEPVLPPTRGLSARGKGIVKVRGVRFRAKRGDDTGAGLAERLGSDAQLAERLAKVHFERIRVEPDGRPVIRHLGGSVVWVLFPPLVKRVPLVAEQLEATLAALEAFTAASPGPSSP